ncbi:MAG: beta-lactamase family protein [Acidobacteriota bacterium]|nr:MAG: beta-lactamase family protein [Acidobacteriota bacterium]
MYFSGVRLFSFLILTALVNPWNLIAQPLEPAAPEVVGVSSQRLSRLDQVVEKAIADEEVPGAIVLVARKGKVIYRKAFGLQTKDPDKPLAFDTVFDMASLTKVMTTATSIMILAEEGRVALSQPVAEYIEEFKKRRKDRITVLQLLTHYSGLRPDLDLSRQWSGYDKAIELACNEIPLEKPGEKFIYSDINYFLLGEIVRRVTGQTLDEFADERIFKPLGMMETGFNPDPAKVERIAPTEKRDGEMLRGHVHDPTASRMGGVAGHAGLFSTVDDTARWAQMILNGGVFDGSRILSPLAVLKMISPQTPFGEGDWRGIGFDIETRFSTPRGDLFPVSSFGHTGFTGTSVWIDPYSETLVVMMTSRLYPNGEGGVVALRSKVASVVAGSLLDLKLDLNLAYRRY